MLIRHYLHEGYTLVPLDIHSDLSISSLQWAAYSIQEDINQKYILFCSKENYDSCEAIKKQDLQVAFDDSLVNVWGVIDPKLKLIVYSPGA